MAKPVKLESGRLKEFGVGDAVDAEFVQGGGVPTYIAPTATFLIPQFTQALYSLTIIADGLIMGDGVLVEVN